MLSLGLGHSTSRGIGLELVTQLTADPSNLVIATCRSPDSAEGLHKLKSSSQGSNLHIVPLDVVDESSIRASETIVKGILGDKGIDYLINNAAVVGMFVVLTVSVDPHFLRSDGGCRLCLQLLVSSTPRYHKG